MEKETTDEKQSPSRKPFVTPRLRVYGHVSALTQANSNRPGIADSGGTSHHRTAG
jgi:hypothetical protein